MGKPNSCCEADKYDEDRVIIKVIFIDLGCGKLGGDEAIHKEFSREQHRYSS